MALNKKILSQIILLLIGILLIFFIYFYSDQKQKPIKKIEKDKIIGEKVLPENTSTFEDIQYEGMDINGNEFIINAKYAEFQNDIPNIINMEKILCRFFLKMERY